MWSIFRVGWLLALVAMAEVIEPYWTPEFE
jgi:hypothetical protein